MIQRCQEGNISKQSSNQVIPTSKTQRNINKVDLRSILNLDGTDLVEAPVHDVLALQHELTALSLEVLLLPDCDLELVHRLHLLSVHGCCFSLRGYSLGRGRGFKKEKC